MRNRAGQLSAQQRKSLERDGYLMVPSLLDETVTARMAGRLSELVCQTVAAWAADPAPDIAEPGVVREAGTGRSCIRAVLRPSAAG